MMWHDETTRPPVAPSFSAWLEGYVFSDDEYFGVVEKSDVEQ
jgi:hypothetical protein